MNPLLFLTRFDPTDDSVAAKATEMGFTVLRVPMIATEAGVDSPAIARRFAEMGQGTALAWTSRRAAEALARVLPGARAELARVPMYCVGEESALPIRRVGYEPQTPEHATGEELGRYILERAPKDGIRCVIYLRGDRSLPDLPATLKSGGLEVFSLEVYRTRFLDADLSGLLAWLRRGEPVVVAYFSPSCVYALDRMLDQDSRDALRRSAVAIARGDTTARALEERKYGRVLRPARGVSFERIALETFRTIVGEPA